MHHSHDWKRNRNYFRKVPKLDFLKNDFGISQFSSWKGQLMEKLRACGFLRPSAIGFRRLGWIGSAFRPLVPVRDLLRSFLLLQFHLSTGRLMMMMLPLMMRTLQQVDANCRIFFPLPFSCPAPLLTECHGGRCILKCQVRWSTWIQLTSNRLNENEFR